MNSAYKYNLLINMAFPLVRIARKMNFKNSIRTCLLYLSRSLPISKKKILNLLNQLQTLINAQQALINQLQTQLNQQKQSLLAPIKQNSEQLNDLYNTIWQLTPLHLSLMETLFAKSTACYKVFFIITDISLWDTFHSIYTAFANDPHFDAVAIVSPRIDISISVSYEDMLNFFKTKNINYLPGYSPKNNQWLDLTELTPHLVFYTLGSSAYWPKHKIEYVSTFTRTCYLSYSFLLTDQESSQYNASFHKSAWRIFSQTPFHQQKYHKYHHDNPNKIVLSGYPKFDYYQRNNDIFSTEFISPWKNTATTTSKKIIWAPHWTIANILHISCANFEKYYKDFLDYAKKTKHLQWLLKPHPNLMWACENQNILTKTEFMSYLAQWQNLPNGQTYQLAHYFDFFVTSDALILDSISFLAEYLPTQKPVLFLEKPNRPRFNEIGEKIIDSYYRAFCFQDVIDFIDQVVIKGNDVLYEKRKRCLEQYYYFPKEGAGIQILNYIKDKFNIDS